MYKNRNISYPSEFSFESYSFLLELIDNPIIVTDKMSRVLFINNAFVKTYHFPKEEFLNKTINILFDEKDVDKLESIFALANGEVFESRLKQKTKKDDPFTALIKASRLHYDNDDLYLFIIKQETDLHSLDNDPNAFISQKHQSLGKTESIEDKFFTLFYEIKDVIYESTPGGRIIDINPAGIELFGFDNKKELLNVNIADELYVNPNDRDHFKDRLEKYGYVKDYEIEVKKKNGDILTVLETAFVVKNNEGEITAYRGIIRDITEIKSNQVKLKKYIDELAEVNKQLIISENELKNLNASKDKFFSIVAHDLRSPFTSLIGYSEFLKEDLNELTKEEIKTFAENINESSRTVFNLLENLLQWSRVQTDRISLEPIVFDISILADQAIKLLKNNSDNKYIDLSNKIPPRTLVHADENTISSVIQNLVSNAIKFTPVGGSVTITGEQDGSSVTVTVEDNGVGIHPDDIEKLFRIDNQHTTTGTENESGSGLGLILCKELIEKNKGKIWVESQPGKGSRFYFTLPMHA